MNELEQALAKYLTEGRRCNAQSYEVSAGFMRAIYDRILSDRGKISRYDQLLQIERIKE